LCPLLGNEVDEIDEVMKVIEAMEPEVKFNIKFLARLYLLHH
jgi:hypothetical protein